VASFGAYTLADQVCSTATHRTNSITQQLPGSFWHLQAIVETPNPMPVTRAFPPEFPSNHTAKDPRMLQHALIEYEIWQRALRTEVHPTALVTPKNHTSKDRRHYGSRLTQEHKQVLTSLFAQCKKPTTGEKQDLANRFGVIYAKIDVSYASLSANSHAPLKLTAKNWFQNQRMILRKSAKRKPQVAHTNFTSPCKSHTISGHPCRDMNQRTVSSYAATPDPTSQYSSVPKPAEMRDTACVSFRTGSRAISTNAVHCDSKRNMYQQQPTIETVTNRAPAVFRHNVSQISEVRSSTVSLFDHGEISSDHIPRPQVSIEGVSSVARPTLSRTRLMRLTYRDNPLYSTASEIPLLTETARAGGIRYKAKYPTIEPLVNYRSVEEQGSDFFSTFIPT